MDEEVSDFFGNGRDGRFFGVAKEAAVDVGEGGEFGGEEAVAVLFLLVKNFEEVYEGVAGVFGAVGFEVTGEGVGGKEAGVFGVETENDADAEDVQIVEVFGGDVSDFGFVFGEEGLIELIDFLAGFDGDFDFDDVGEAGVFVDEDGEFLIVFGEVFEENFHGLAVGFASLHVVDPDFAEVGRNDVAGAF